MGRVPHTRRVPGSGIVVDYFGPVRASWMRQRFLSHAHADHTQGLEASYAGPSILCSVLTADLVALRLGVPRPHLAPLPLRMAVPLAPWGLSDWSVTLLDANHCPGAVMFLIEGPQGRFLHSGDMRFEEEAYEREGWEIAKGVDILYLDTTYCNPRYVFPSQREAVEKAIDVVAEEIQKGKPLVLIPTYTIGKERILVALARKFGSRVRVSSYKAQTLRVLNLWDGGVYTEDMDEDSPFIAIRWDVVTSSVPWGWNPRYEAMQSLLNAENARRKSPKEPFDRVVALVATGWSFQVKSKISVQRKDNLCAIGIPYSEHSSYTELLRFVELIRPKRVIPTVGNSSEAAERRLVAHFRQYIDSVGAKRAFFEKFSKGASRRDRENIVLPASQEHQNDIPSTDCRVDIIDLSQEQKEDVGKLSANAVKEFEKTKSHGDQLNAVKKLIVKGEGKRKKGGSSKVASATKKCRNHKQRLISSFFKVR